MSSGLKYAYLLLYKSNIWLRNSNINFTKRLQISWQEEVAKKHQNNKIQFTFIYTKV